MKKAYLFLLVLCLFAPAAHADETSALSQQAMESVQQRTQEMSALGIPEAQAKKMLTQMVQNRFQKQNQLRAQQVVMDTAKAGLPTEPVMNKAMEGMAKQAKEQQVIRAMETVRSRYAHAHQLAKALSEDEETVNTLTRTMADSVAAGMKIKDMEAVAAQIRTQTRQQTQTRNKAEEDQLAIQTMQVVRTMARRGFDSTDVSEALCQALQNRYSYRHMKQLQKHVAHQAHLGTPQQIANQHAQSIGKGNQSGSSGSSGSGSGGSGSGSGGSGSGSGGSGSGSGGSGSGSGG